MKDKRNKYPIISYGTCDENLMLAVINILKKINVTYWFRLNFLRVDKGYIKGYAIRNELFLYGRKNLEEWMKVISFRSPKHITKYLLWKELGYLPKDTTTPGRISLLKEYGLDTSKIYTPEWLSLVEHCHGKSY